jgi:hypothetical protein
MRADGDAPTGWKSFHNGFDLLIMPLKRWNAEVVVKIRYRCRGRNPIRLREARYAGGAGIRVHRPSNFLVLLVPVSQARIVVEELS